MLDVATESGGYAPVCEGEANHVLGLIPGLKTLHEPQGTIQTKMMHVVMTPLTHEPDAKIRCSGIQAKLEQEQLETEEQVQLKWLHYPWPSL